MSIEEAESQIATVAGRFSFIRRVETIGKTGSHEALLALLELAGNEGLIRKERELALKHAMKIVKSSHA